VGEDLIIVCEYDKYEIILKKCVIYIKEKRLVHATRDVNICEEQGMNTREHHFSRK
jgi:hypothetical protein